MLLDADATDSLLRAVIGAVAVLQVLFLTAVHFSHRGEAAIALCYSASISASAFLLPAEKG